MDRKPPRIVPRKISELRSSKALPVRRVDLKKLGIVAPSTVFGNNFIRFVISNMSTHLLTTEKFCDILDVFD
jgi:hypothetical protein